MTDKEPKTPRITPREDDLGRARVEAIRQMQAEGAEAIDAGEVDRRAQKLLEGKKEGT